MTRFRPSVEALDDRALPSAVIAGADAPTPDPVLPAQAAQPADEATGQTEVAKVTMQDFHFTSKVSVQDFHFVIKLPKSSP